MFDVCTFCMSRYISTGKEILHKGSQNLPRRTPLSSLATGLLWPPLGPFFICRAGALEWDDLCSLVGTVSEDGVKRCQKAKVTPQIFPTSNNPMKHPWNQLNPNGPLDAQFCHCLSPPPPPPPQPVNSPIFAPPTFAP